MIGDWNGPTFVEVLVIVVRDLYLSSLTSFSNLDFCELSVSLQVLMSLDWALGCSRIISFSQLVSLFLSTRFHCNIKRWQHTSILYSFYFYWFVQFGMFLLSDLLSKVGVLTYFAWFPISMWGGPDYWP